MNKETALRVAKSCYPNDTIENISLTSRARLWAGMGNIYQVSWHNNNTAEDGKKKKKTLIVKYVHPRLPAKGQLSIGDQRKLDSYIVEANFYKHYAQDLLEQHHVPLPPPPYYTERNIDDNPRNPTIIIAMGELAQSRPSSGQEDEGDAHAQAMQWLEDYDDTHEDVVKWLAHFHAATWQRPHDDQVQAVGSYWHLDTRPNEWQDMARHGWEGRLKRAAKAIDERLKRDPLQCWVHGDTKDANILYTTGSDLAFCDFQYVGRGPPTRDLSYYFCSAHVEDADEQDALVQLYLDTLVPLLEQRQIAPLPTRQQLNDSLELAFADFCRFMAGWGYWGYDLSKQVQATLDKLDGGKMLKTEEEYQEAMKRVFG